MKSKRLEPIQPIPKNARLVFKGIIFDVYQWPQKLFDGTSTTFELLKRPDTAVVIPITPEGKIVLAKQQQPGKKPFLSVIGGRAETEEDLESTAKRELLEETGMQSKKLVLWDVRQPINKIDWTINTYIAQYSIVVTKPKLDAGEKIRLKLVTFEEFMNLAIKDTFKDDVQIKLNIMEAMLDTRKMSDLKKLFLQS